MNTVGVRASRPAMWNWRRRRRLLSHRLASSVSNTSIYAHEVNSHADRTISSPRYCRASRVASA